MIWIMHLSTLFSWVLVPGYRLRSGIVGWEDGLLTNLNHFLLGNDFGLLPSNTVSMETYWANVNTERQLCSQATMLITKMAPDWWTISDWKDYEWTQRPQRPTWPGLNRKLVSLWGVSYNGIRSLWGLRSCPDDLLQEVAHVVYKTSLCQGKQHPPVQYHPTEHAEKQPLDAQGRCTGCCCAKMLLFLVLFPSTELSEPGAKWQPIGSCECDGQVEPKTASGDRPCGVDATPDRRVCLSSNLIDNGGKKPFQDTHDNLDSHQLVGS